ncbi:hypothetical protein D3OALGA1CA_3607 [Olavius algarvensis associated proteobacterium Delta 3]|nr:hypothetical protein D3OALGA1CA_3607 [Olavius algarvensis associated proteobacterium Delta 3]CAB5147026.1 hypothetical protein D3OALGB2SA_4568 [Olavius algarvensis associated proteobacterium Delta 3]
MDRPIPHHRRNGWIFLAAVFGSLLVVTGLFDYMDLDRRISRLFYTASSGWFLNGTPPWNWLYRYGTVPGVVLTAGSLVLLAAGVARKQYRHWRRDALLIFLTAVIGGGLIVNSALKPFWGRPRPGQITEFGGQWEYRSPLQPGTPGKGQSFPCGHCTMGYIFVTLFFLRRRYPRVAYLGGSFGILYGAVVSVGRIVDGGHFPTDTLWSLGIILLVAGVLYYFILKIPDSEARPERTLSPARRRLLIYGLPVLLALISAAFFTRRPFYETYVRPFPVPPGTRMLQIVINAPPDRFHVSYRPMDSGRVIIHASGFGWANASHGLLMEEDISSPVARIVLTVQPKGYFSELTHQVDVNLPEALKDAVTVDLQEIP